MSIQEYRNNIINYINKIDDEMVLRAILKYIKAAIGEM